MFQQEFNGYKKSEVDAFIQSMKASYETKLMAEKFKVLDAEKKLLEYAAKKQEIEYKEQNIINVIEKQKKYQEEGSKKIYGLVIDKLDFIINELEMKFPQFKRDKEYSQLLEELSNTINSYKENVEKPKAITHPVNSENDSIRMLLNKMQNYKKKENTSKQETNIFEKPSFYDFEDEEDLKPKEKSQTAAVKKPSKYDDKQKAVERIYEYIRKENESTPANSFFDTKPKFYDYDDEKEDEKQEKIVVTPDTNENNKTVENKNEYLYLSPQAIPPSDSGFSFQEALNPTEDLEEIMKAFDFYNDANN